MLIAILATAAAQQTRVELTIYDASVGGAIAFPLDGFSVVESKPVQFSGGGGAASGRRAVESVRFTTPVHADTAPLVGLFTTEVAMDTVAVRTYRTASTGPDLLLQELVYTNAVFTGYELVVTPDAPRIALEVGAACGTTTAFAYDDLGTQTHASTYTWSYEQNQPGC